MYFYKFLLCIDVIYVSRNYSEDDQRIMIETLVNTLSFHRSLSIQDAQSHNTDPSLHCETPIPFGYSL